MEQKKYVAYVGTYTHGSSLGIHVYDIDMETGRYFLHKQLICFRRDIRMEHGRNAGRAEQHPDHIISSPHPDHINGQHCSQFHESVQDKSVDHCCHK